MRRFLNLSDSAGPVECAISLGLALLDSRDSLTGEVLYSVWNPVKAAYPQNNPEKLSFQDAHDMSSTGNEVRNLMALEHNKDERIKTSRAEVRVRESIRSKEGSTITFLAGDKVKEFTAQVDGNSLKPKSAEFLDRVCKFFGISLAA